ncbi:TadE family protein [Rhodopirellula maiorica SM1]|uniref:TadE family protein n=1 Tax=Rhodopirellula maiorica SM1 TaxID=1265738 RepID=M5RUF7_9BACT|nr:TadE family protein [Rhodopirellula maiorica]EMI22806.1 TadE family protein [Rhodopirellula maiorica SM1]
MTTTKQRFHRTIDPQPANGKDTNRHLRINRPRRRSRHAVAAAEFAVCLPILVLLVFGSIEASSFIFLKQALSVAAYEGAREAALSTSTNSAAEDRAINILNARNVRDFAVRFPDRSPEQAKRGEEIAVEIVAPTQSNSPLAGQFIANRDLIARVVMLKE